MTTDADALVREFDARKHVYEQFASECETVVRKLLVTKGVRTHEIGSRVKTSKSLLKKIQRPDKDYAVLADVTDLVGVRVTLYFEDQVDSVDKIIRSEFVVNDDKSIDKRKKDDPTAFGYTSLHLICEFPVARVALTELAAFKGLVFEVQIRSILQHAWAEIEHDLGYKSEVAVPSHLRRRFSRIAALLELADGEFVHVRDDLSSYSKEVAGRVTARSTTVPLDGPSLLALAESDAEVGRIAAEIAKNGGVTIVKTPPQAIESNVKMLKTLGLTTIDEVRRYLAANADNIIALARGIKYGVTTLYRAIPIFYLAELLAGTLPTEEATVKWAADIPLGNVREFAKKIRAFVASHPVAVPPWLV